MIEIGSIYNGWKFYIDLNFEEIKYIIVTFTYLFHIKRIIKINIIKIPKQSYFLYPYRIHRIWKEKAARKFRKGAKKSSFHGPGRWKLKLAVTRPFRRRNMTSVGGPPLGPKRRRGSARRLRDPGRVVRSNCV